MTTFRHLGDEPVHQGHIWHVVVADFESPDGQRFRRDIVRSPGSVGVVPLVFDAEGVPSVVLVRQYRPPYQREIIEIPAGMRDVPGEDPATDSVCSIYLATGCTPVDHDRQGPEEQHMEIVHVPLEEALAMIDRGEITDAKTVCGLLAADRRIRIEQG
jgi:ADP-ribose pyrophosphatase